MIAALGSIIRRDWSRHRVRLILTIAGIALGVGVYFAIRTANSALVTSLSSTIEKMAGKATLQVVAGEAGFSENVLTLVRDTPGVSIAEPVTETVASTSISSGQKILVLGLDLGSELELYTDTVDQSTLIVKDPLAFSDKKESVAITASLAQRAGLAEGDKLTVETQSGPLELTVRGIFAQKGIGEVYDGNVAVMDIFSAQALFGRGNKIDRIDIANADGVTIDQLQSELRSRLPAGIDVVRPNLRGESLENSVSTLHVGFTITSLLALSIGVFIIFNSFSISLSQRWKEIAILRSLGVERHAIKRMFLVEAIVLGVAGSAIGVAGGFLMALGAMGMLVNIASTFYGHTPTASAIELNWTFVGESFLLGLVVSLLAAYYPARAAAHLKVADALRNIETRQPEGRAGNLRVIVGLAMIASGLLLTRYTPPEVGNYLQTTFAFAMLIGMVLLLPRILEIASVVLRPVVSRVFGPEGVIAVETMAKSPRRTVATVGAIVVGSAFVFGNASLIQSQKAAINRSVDKALAADMLVTSSNQLHSRTYHFTEATAQTIAAMTEVEMADLLRVTSTNYNGVEVSLIAHDMREYFAISPDLLDSGDARRAAELTARGEGILISNNMALRWNIDLGEIVEINAPGGELRLPVVGMLNYYRSEFGTIFIERELYKRYWNDSDVDYLFIDLKEGSDETAFKDSVQAAIAGSQRAYIYTHQEYKVWVTKLIDQLFLMMYMQMVVAVLVAAIGLVNTMLISVAERTHEIGVFRAIGGQRGQVIKMILIEAAAISLMGLAAGAAAGAMNAYFLINTAAKVVAGFSLPMELPYGVVALSIPLVIIVSLASAWIPARSASRTRVAEALRYE